ncbi:hypothetical protein C8J55DRAFT_396537, partial [Lentinula edodes]
MTKMVNLLATKLELGSPMISMYLLQNPDHYTSQIFVPFYWKPFVRHNRYIGLSSAYDYTHCPREHEQYNLYDWIQKFYRIKSRRATKKKHTDDNHSDDSNTDEDYIASRPKAQSSYALFLNGHPLSSTHSVAGRKNYLNVVPNFIGPPLPRPDKDDREYYCCTMLTIFKPWRTGADLKSVDDSWHEAFCSHPFNDQERLYIKNMNLRYECLDSRDD